MSARLILLDGQTAAAVTVDGRRLEARGERASEDGAALLLLPRVRYSLRVEPQPPEALGGQGDIFSEEGLLVLPQAAGPDGLVRSVQVMNLSDRSVRVAHGAALLARARGPSPRLGICPP